MDSQVPMFLNSCYLLFASLMVLTMVAGLIMLTTGLIRAKNTNAVLVINICAIVFAFLVYIGVGYQLMFAAHSTPYFPHLKLFFSFGPNWVHYYEENISTLKLIQVFFHVSTVLMIIVIIVGATSERLKLWAMLLFSIFISGFIYPILGYWFNPGGFLANMKFIDLSGVSTAYLTAATASLAALIIMGPRRGKYSKTNKINPIPGCNMPLAVLGMTLFCFGSLGINSGYLAQSSNLLSLHSLIVVFINTAASSASSIFIVILMSRLFFAFQDLSMLINAAMIGVIAMSAAPVYTTLPFAMVIGAIAGLFGFMGIILFDKIKLDDPIGGVATFGIGSIWGLIAAALLTKQHTMMSLHHYVWALVKQVLIQFNGIILIFAWVFISSLIFWGLIKLIIGLRPSAAEELRGLDGYECGSKAYPEFVTVNRTT